MVRSANSCLLALLALASGLLCAQEYSFHSFGPADGLSNLAVKRIYQDQTGFIWVSSENGIFRYDGDRFESFGPSQGLPNTSDAAFGEAPDGSLLVGGDFGLYLLSNNRFARISEDAKAINRVEGIQTAGKGHTFLGTDSGLLELYTNPGRPGFGMRRFPQVSGTSDPGAYGIFVDGDNLWYGCGLALCRRDAHGTRVWGLGSGLPNRELLVILKDGAGNLWVRAKHAGIFEMPAGQTRFRRPDSSLPASDIDGIPAMDDDGRILLPSPDGLLIQNGKAWQKVDRSSGLRGNVYSAFEDRQHALWIGLAGRGLVRWGGYREWESYSMASGLTSEVVYEILPRHNGSLWVATTAGLLRGKRQKFGMAFSKVPALGGFRAHSLRAGPDGDLWVGTETRGVARFHERTGTVEWFSEEQGIPDHGVYTLRFDREQRLWVATESGLFMAKSPYLSFARVDDLPATRMWTFTEGTDGRLWAGGAGGLFEYTLGRWKNLTCADGLSNQEIFALGAGPSGTIWVGYRFGGGIDRVHPSADGETIEKGVQRPGTDGLVYFLNFDSRGRLWAGTERGVDMWDGSRWSHYDMTDGLAWDDCDLNGFAEEPDGTVWIGTSGGLSRFKPHPQGQPNVPLEVVFTRLAMGQTDVSGLRNPSFGKQANSLTARYSALNASRENGVIFRYRLGGSNSAWTETAQRELQFANLAPGAYLLEIEARDSDGRWTGHGAEFPFTILTPWYLSWWFISLCVLIPLSVAAGVLRIRIVGAQRRERELVRMVEERTTDLRRANQELSLLSFTDPLTGLANRRVFDQTLDKECARLRRSGSSLSLLSIDVDHFKALNDSQGHQRGDEYLVLLGAELVKIARRQIDVAARCGGEEFAIILPLTGAADALLVGESVREAIAGLKLPHPASPVTPVLTVSVGVATAAGGWCSTPEELVAMADQALYAAKRAGRNRVCVAQREADRRETGMPPALNAL